MVALFHSIFALVVFSVFSIVSARRCPKKTISYMDESFHLLPFLKGSRDYTGYNGKEAHIHGSRHCPHLQSIENPASVKRTCPVYYVINYMANRIPSMIAEARCSCTLCLHGNKEEMKVCQPIYYYRTVTLTDSRSNCTKEVIGKFVVGCECKRAESEGSDLKKTLL